MAQGFLRDFFALYKSLPCLWHKNDPSYKDKFHRELAMIKLTKMYRELSPNATQVKVRRELDAFKSCLDKEHIRKIEALKTGLPADSEVWYYEDLSFLLYSNAPKPAAIQKAKNLTQSKIDFRKRILTPRCLNEDNSKPVRKFKNVPAAKNTDGKDKFDLLAEKLRSLPTEQFSYIENILTNIFKFAEHENQDGCEFQSSAKSVLLTKKDFQESGDYQSDVLNGLEQESQECSLPVPKKILFPIESVRLGWTGKDWQVGTGMQNIGNTCYLNATLQALFHVPALANWLMSEVQHSEQCRQSDACVICEMRSTFLTAQRGSGPINPWQVYSKVRLICGHLMPGRQEDAHEFLRYLVVAMEKSYLSRYRNMGKDLDQYSKDTTPLNQILGGYLRSAVRCLSCGHVSTTFQHFQDLLLDILKAKTLEEALDLFFSLERLEDLRYKCNACNKKVSATKQFYMERAPMVLCIALKRFSPAGGKLSKHIQFRKKITLNKYIFHKNKQSLLSYRLVSLVTHLGPSQNYGHYTAVGQAPGGGFYQFDDDCVRSIPLTTVLGTDAYIIFFEKDSCPLEQTAVSSESPFK